MKSRLLSLCVIAALSACGETPADPDPSPNPTGNEADAGGNADAGQTGLPSAEFCEQLERGARGAFLRSLNQCGDYVTEAEFAHLPLNNAFGQANAATFGEVLSAAGCAAGLGFVDSRFAASAAQGRMTYDPDRAEACQRDGRNAQPAAQLDTVDAGLCRDVWRGTVASGGACAFHEECAGPNTYCRPASDDSCGGTCAPKPGLGEDCRPGLDRCRDFAECGQLLRDGGTDGGYHCQGPLPAGAACDVFFSCEQGSSCLRVPDGGEACLPLNVPEGQPCMGLGSNGANCVQGLLCQRGDGGVVGHCVKPASLGEACTRTAFNEASTRPPCGPCLHCDPDNRCVAREPGMLCQFDGDCGLPLFCAAGICAKRPRTGELCLSGSGESGNAGNCLYADDYCKRPPDGGLGGACTKLPRVGEGCGPGFSNSTACLPDAPRLGFDAQKLDLKLVSFGAFCNVPRDGGAGVCEPFPSVGQRCSLDGGSPLCRDPQTYCDLTLPDGGPSVEGTCRALPSTGPCLQGASPCAEGSFCAADGGSQLCRPKLASGETCSAATECQSGVCAEGRNVCVAECFDERASAGCPDAKTLSVLLAFSVVLLGARKRRRE